MKQNKNSIDDLFRERLANKEMPLLNSGFPFDFKGSSKHQNWTSKILNGLKTTKLIISAATVVIVGTVYISLNKKANDQQNNSKSLINSVPQDNTNNEKTENTVIIMDTLKVSVPTNEKQFSTKNSNYKEVTSSDTTSEFFPPIEKSKISNSIEVKCTDSEKENLYEQKNIENLDTLKTDSLQQKNSLINSNEEEKEEPNINKKEKIIIPKEETKPDTVKKNTIDKKKGRKKRKVKKLR